VAFKDAGNADFNLVSGSAAIDAGQPLTRTKSAGSGKVVPVINVAYFSAGFKTVTLIPQQTLIPGI